MMAQTTLLHTTHMKITTLLNKLLDAMIYRDSELNRLNHLNIHPGFPQEIQYQRDRVASEMILVRTYARELISHAMSPA